MAKIHKRDLGMLATVQGVEDHLQVFTRHSVTESAVESPAVLPLPKTFQDEDQYGASAHRGSNHLNEEREDADISAPRGPFTIKGFGKIGNRHQSEARGPRSSLSDGSSSSSGDEDGTNSSPYYDASGRTVTCCSYAGKQATHTQHGGSVDAIVIEAKQRHGIQDYMSVAVVAGFLVPCFTVFAPLSVIGPAVWASKHGVGNIAPYVAIVMGSFAVPLYYSAYFKKVVWRPLMLELTNYVRPFKVIKHATLPADKNYIVCWHPHGRLFYGFAVFCGLFDVFFPELNNKEFFSGVTEALLLVPVLRNLLALTGTIACSKKKIDGELSRGNSVGLIVGGIEEVLEGTFEHQDVLYLQNRKGFAKMAMTHKAGLVPVYAFGENQLFRHESATVLAFWRYHTLDCVQSVTHFDDSNDAEERRLKYACTNLIYPYFHLLANVNKYIKVGAPVPIRGVMNAPIPYRSELVIAVGAPLFAGETETLDAFHARYVAALQALFDRHVSQTSRPQHRLVIK